MEWATLIFYLIAAVCVVSALGVVVSSNPVHSAVFLMLCFLNIAATFVMLGADFLAVVQVIVYTGAILVLVLFLLMLVDTKELPDFHTGEPLQRVVGALLGVILLLETGAAIIGREVVGTPGDATRENVEAVGGNTQALGRVLYDDYLLVFIVISMVLTVGVIGAIVLALPERLERGVARLRRNTISLSHGKGVDEEPLVLPGPAGETPIVVHQRPEPVSADGQRRIILVRDPDAYTDVGGEP
jgi:NADH-quinone oxidoreductase subunit J